MSWQWAEMCWIGVDGTRDGWCAAIIFPQGKVELRFLRELNDIWHFLQYKYAMMAIAIDMPIALAECAQQGGRGCDRHARRILSSCKRKAVRLAELQKQFPSQSQTKSKSESRSNSQSQSNEQQSDDFVSHSSIFTPPSRPALESFNKDSTHKDVSNANIESGKDETQGNPSKKRRTTSTGKSQPSKSTGLGLSIQTFNIMPKINEVSLFVMLANSRDEVYFDLGKKRANHSKAAIFECHPELAFLAMSARQQGGITKGSVSSLQEQVCGLHSKKGLQGRKERIELLRKNDILRFEHLAKSAGVNRTAGTAAFANRTTWSIQCIGANEEYGQRKPKGSNSVEYVNVPADDVLDSLACAVSAYTFTEKQKEIFVIKKSDDDEVEEKNMYGYPLAIFC